MPTRYFAQAGQVKTLARIQIHADNISESRTSSSARGSQVTTDAPARALAPTSSNEMNRIQTTPSRDHPTPPKTTNGTIRAVPAEPLQINTLEADRRLQSTSDEPPILQPSIAFSPLRIEQPRSSSPPPVRNSLPVANGIVRSISAEFGPMRTYSTSPQLSMSEEANGNTGTSPGSQWSSAVGRASLGKSGRVIEKLQSENDMLKREIISERKRADEMRKGFMLAEEKVEKVAEEYEKRLLHAANNENLLKRQDRRLAFLAQQVEVERARVDTAVENARVWKEEVERMSADCKAKVEENSARAEEAQMHAMMMESRNKLLEDHWKDRNDNFREQMSSMNSQIAELVADRKDDDEKIQKLNKLCEEQAEQLKLAQQQNEAIWKMFEAYKKTSEADSNVWREKFEEQERRNVKVIEDAEMMVHQVKWAIEHQNA